MYLRTRPPDVPSCAETRGITLCSWEIIDGSADRRHHDLLQPIIEVFQQLDSERIAAPSPFLTVRRDL